jgi:mannose-1-phosphate guanylyltransferase
LLQQVVASFQSIVPSRKMYALVSARDQTLAREQVSSWSGAKVVAVPEGQGSASVMLQILAELVDECSEAEVMAVSANSYIPNPRPFLEAMLSARERLGLVPAVLVGATASRAVPSMKWLVPGGPLGDGIYAFREAKSPSSEEECRKLKAQGAMWNTASFVARGRFLWQILARQLPTQAASITQLWRRGFPKPETLARAVADAAQGAPAVDVVEVLLQENNAIGVVRVDGSGWNAWNSAEEVLHSLASPLERGWLLSRLGSTPASTRSPRFHQEAVAANAQLRDRGN